MNEIITQMFNDNYVTNATLKKNMIGYVHLKENYVFFGTKE